MLLLVKFNYNTIKNSKFVAILNECHKTLIHGLEHGLNPWTFE